MTVYELIAHLRKCPPDFLQASNLKKSDGLHTEALVADIYRKITGEYAAIQFDITSSQTFKNCSSEHLISIQIACWLLSQETFRGEMDLLLKVNTFLSEELAVLSKYVKHQKWLEDEDRAEEMVRLALKTCGIAIAGESVEESADRLESLSTIKRLGVLEKSKKAYERMLAIRKKMAEKKAREAANPYGRE